MSRSNLEYGAIIEADDDNDGDLVCPQAMETIANSYQGQTDLEFHGNQYHAPANRANPHPDFTAQEDIGKPQSILNR
jgi:hypothetical protein